jgi:hypothetical protein
MTYLEIFSLNVQALVNSDLKFMDVLLGDLAHHIFSTYSNIFRNSRLYARLESEEFNNMANLGDSCYALKPCILTPIANTVGRIENAIQRISNPNYKYY